MTILVLQMLRQNRRKLRTSELIQRDKDMDEQMQEAAIGRSRTLDNLSQGKYSIWRRDYESPNSDSTLKLMRDQIIMAKAYANIAKSNNESTIYDSLMKHSRESQHVIEEANSDAELPQRSTPCFLFLLFRHT